MELEEKCDNGTAYWICFTDFCPLLKILTNPSAVISPSLFHLFRNLILQYLKIFQTRQIFVNELWTDSSKIAINSSIYSLASVIYWSSLSAHDVQDIGNILDLPHSLWFGVKCSPLKVTLWNSNGIDCDFDVFKDMFEMRRVKKRLRNLGGVIQKKLDMPSISSKESKTFAMKVLKRITDWRLNFGGGAT